MAVRDHTVRTRLSVPPDSAPVPSPNGPSSPDAWPASLRRGTRADIAPAVLALSRLCHDSEQCRGAQWRSFPAKPMAWPLSAAALATLGTAIHCLRQYARLLGCEPAAHTAPVR